MVDEEQLTHTPGENENEPKDSSPPFDEGNVVEVTSPMQSKNGNSIAPGIYIFTIIDNQTALAPINGGTPYAIDIASASFHLQEKQLTREHTRQDIRRLLQKVENSPEVEIPIKSTEEETMNFLREKGEKDRIKLNWAQWRPEKNRIQTYKSGDQEFFSLWRQSNTISSHNPIEKSSLIRKYLDATPGTAEHEILEQAEGIMMQTFAEARAFVPGKIEDNTAQEGFIVQGNDWFAFEAGNSFGVRITAKSIEPIFYILEYGSEEELKAYCEFLKGAFVHEITHRLRDEFGSSPTNEIASHAIQFLIVEGKNARFNEDLTEELDGKNEGITLYGNARPTALQLIRKKLALHPEVDQSSSSFRPDDLQKIIASIPDTKRYNILKKIAEEIIRTPAEELQRIANE